jgi:hypothetical protein
MPIFYGENNVDHFREQLPETPVGPNFATVL